MITPAQTSFQGSALSGAYTENSNVMKTTRVEKKDLQLSKMIDLKVAIKTKTFSDSQIDELFDISGIGKGIKRWSHRNEVKRLEVLPLSFRDCKSLFHDIHISIEHLENYINNLNLNVNQIQILRGIYNLNPYQVKVLLDLHISSDESIHLLKKGLGYEQIKSLVGTKAQTPSSIIEHLRYLSIEELLNLDTESFVFISNIKKICKIEHDTAELSLKSYELIYNSIPSVLTDDIIKSTKKLLNLGFPPSSSASKPSPKPELPSNSNSWSFEDILLYYMNLASGKAVTIISDTSACFNIVIKIIDKVGNSKNGEILNLFPVKPFLLATIWTAMIASIESKYVVVSSLSFKEIVKAVSALLISLLTGVTGFFHSGGTGLEPFNVTNYISQYYKAQQLIKNKFKKVYAQIPDILKFKTDESFDNLSKEEQLSIGRALSMAYTFRVGDNMISALADKSIFSLKAAKKVVNSIWPLPMSSESKRMYFLHSGFPIYTTVDISEIFVQVPTDSK